jgi:hypothetical protein
MRRLTATGLLVAGYLALAGLALAVAAVPALVATLAATKVLCSEREPENALEQSA